jgi:predicted phosphoribosyltransferase
MLFQDRFEAGQLLASELTMFANRADIVFVVRKLGVPGLRGAGLGAIASGNWRGIGLFFTLAPR